MTMTRRSPLLCIYTFKSETRATLRAFAGDYDGSKLPEKFGPCSVTGQTTAGVALPHRIGRPEVERAIAEEGYQLWRLKDDPPPDAPAPPTRKAAPRRAAPKAAVKPAV